MLYLDERVGCVAVYDHSEKINCMSNLDSVKKLHFYGAGKWNFKKCRWSVQRKILKKARRLYKKLNRLTANMQD